MTAVEAAEARVSHLGAGQGAAGRRSTGKRIAFVVLGAALIAEIAFVAPYLARTMSALHRPDLRWVVLAVVGELLSMGAFARVQRRMLSAGGARVPMRRMIALTYAANAMSASFPGGTALSSGYVFKRFRSWGATVPAAGFTILSSGVLSTVSFASLVVVCAALAGSGGLGSLLILAGVAAAAVSALIIRRRRRSDLLVRVAGRGLLWANRILRRSPDAGLVRLHRIAGEFSAIKPRTRDWMAGFGFAALNWVADLGCLAACCQAVGAERSSLTLVMVAYIAGTSVSGLSLLPGGLGVVDVPMIFALTQGGITTVAATATVVLYRLISFALIVAVGWLVWGTTRLAERRHPAAAPTSFQ